LAGALLGALCATTLAPACSQGEGTGTACGTMDVADCWTGSFNLQPNFFAAVPTQTLASNPVYSLLIRIQNGADYETFSDGIAFTVDNVEEITGGPGVPSLYMQPLSVSLPVGVTPPGVPLVANPTPSIVHAVLYLGKSCRTQNVALYALDAVTLGPDGSCGTAVLGEGANACPLLESVVVDADLNAISDASVDGGAAGGVTTSGPIGSSTIVFNNLFDGNADESQADKRLTDVPFFDLYFADPRDIAPGGLGPPPPCLAHLVGNFSFYFERGQPEQPFP
jgi:hypothetical protein